MSHIINFHVLIAIQLTQDGTTVQTLDGSQENMTVDLTEATLGQDGQIIITGEDGHGSYSL